MSNRIFLPLAAMLPRAGRVRLFHTQMSLSLSFALCRSLFVARFFLLLLAFPSSLHAVQTSAASLSYFKRGSSTTGRVVRVVRCLVRPFAPFSRAGLMMKQLPAERGVVGWYARPFKPSPSAPVWVFGCRRPGRRSGGVFEVAFFCGTSVSQPTL